MTKKRKEYIVLCLLLFLTLFLRFYKLGQQALWYDEAIFSQVAISFIERGKPYGKPYSTRLFFDNPPLHPLLIASFFLIFGINEFSARFSSALLGTFTVFVVYLITKRIIQDEQNYIIGGIAALIYSINPAVMSWDHSALIETTCTFFITTSIYLFVLYEKEEKTKYILLSSVFLGLGMLTKFFALLLYVTYFAYFIIFHKRFWIKIRELIILFILPLLFFFSWVVYGLYLDSNAFLNATLGWFIRMESLQEPWRQMALLPFWFNAIKSVNPLFALLSFLSFIIVMFRNIRRPNLEVLFLLWIIIHFGFISFSSPLLRLTRYVLYIVPVLAILIAKESFHFKDLKINLKSIRSQQLNLKFIVYGLIVCLVIFSFVQLYLYEFYEKDLNREYIKEAGLYIKENTEEDALVIVQWDGPTIGFYARRDYRILYTFDNAEDAIETINQGDVIVIQLDKDFGNLKENEEYQIIIFIKNQYQLRKVILNEEGMPVIEIYI